MVFSFFKKQPQKMPERPAARPRAPTPLPEVKAPVPVPEEVKPLSTPLPDLEFTTSNLSGVTGKPTGASGSQTVIPATPVGASPAADDLDFTDEEFERSFTESSVMAIDVEHDLDPVQADVEQVAVLFSNSQDAAARSLLETFIKSYSGSEGKRFWLLLFDLLQVTGDRQAFDKLCVAYAEACEMSPPPWRQEAPAAVKKAPGVTNFVLQGVLTVEGSQPVAELAALVDKKAVADVDCSKLVGCDDEIAGQLAELLVRARQGQATVTLDGVEAFLKRLDDRLVAGEAEHEQVWLLVLELLQRHGTQERFEERAVDYAVAFERSPPSWETPPKVHVRKAAPARADDAYYLSGELLRSRFDELVPVLDAHDVPILDFSGVRRLDFFSAGQLVNRLAPYKSAGKEIVIRSPNHLVAELMAVVGLNKQARIIVPKS